ncbi:MAG: lecithin retinol acyltransferase family protein [Acidimicrobiia bacterium]
MRPRDRSREARSADEIVSDAKRLVGSTTARYNVFGSNCEHFANWSVTGGYFESLQVRRYFCVRAALSAGLMFATIRFGATPWIVCLTLLLTVTGFVSQVLYRQTPAYLPVLCPQRRVTRICSSTFVRRRT